MARGRITFLSVLLCWLLGGSALALDECGPQEILAASSADTIFVEHRNAYDNCCLELRIELVTEAFVIDLFEVDDGQPCDCLCCFWLSYEVHGFVEGHYVVRVWNEDGSVLHGETEVDLLGSGGSPSLSNVSRGECVDPGAIQVPTTWGRVRAEYR